MSLNSLLRGLLERFQALQGAALMIGFDEVRDWPTGALSALMESGLISPAIPAKSLICGGCEKDCPPMRVHTIPGEHPRAFIMCGEMGRQPVDLERLQQWQISKAAVAALLTANSEDSQITEQLIRDKLLSLPLGRLFSFEADHLRVDSRRLSQCLQPGTETTQPNRFVLTGDHWSITFQGQTRTFNNTMGLRYIARLIRSQGNEMPVSDLYYAVNPPDGDAIDSIHSSMTASQLDENGLSVGDLGDAGDTLTPEGKKRLQEAIRNIQEQIKEANEFGDDERVAELEQQKEELIHYIAAESGLGGKTRKASSGIERLRKAVTKRIRDDIKKITTTFPDLGHHLNETIRTGTQCQYSPHPPVEWSLNP